MLQGSCNDVASRLQRGCKHVARMLQCRKLIQRKALTHSSSDKGCCKDAARILSGPLPVVCWPLPGVCCPLPVVRCQGCVIMQ